MRDLVGLSKTMSLVFDKRAPSLLDNASMTVLREAGFSLLGL